MCTQQLPLDQLENIFKVSEEIFNSEVLNHKLNAFDK